ncbi:MAG: right-handed parallel beta-helix repeat-containing protein, partial [Micrococcales bacterium]|nr:right-handed parallel beta-helix repeat-containing protein [Micrococcales bacterium]
TVTRALERIRAGGTVVLRAGLYNERVFVGLPVTIQAYPGEAVWFDGTRPAPTWRRQGNTWETPFNLRFDHSTPGGSDNFIGPQNTMAGWPQMVFVNGRRIPQVAKAPQGDQFAIDEVAGRLVLATDPTGKDVRVTTLSQSLVVGSPDVTLRGFGVRRFANSVTTYGALYIARPRTLVENVVVEDVATTGITLDGDGSTGSGRLDRVTVRRAGMLGIHGRWADGASITNSIVTEANYERFNNVPSSAGIKIGQSRGVTIDNNRISDVRYATGIWLDEAVVGFRITRNLVTGNGDTGISCELSSSGTILSNQVVGHEQGIALLNTEKTLIANNTTGYNSRADLYLVQDWRRQAQPAPMGHDPRYPKGDSTNTWILRDNTIRNNVFGADGNQRSMFQVYVMDRNTGRAADAMNLNFAGNVFTLRKTIDNPVAFGWGNANNTTTNYDSPEAFQKAKGLPARNVSISSTEFGPGMDEARNLPVAVPLTADEAAAVGTVAGLRVIGSLTG